MDGFDVMFALDETSPYETTLTLIAALAFIALIIWIATKKGR
jgi:hypothetical protein